MVLSVFTACTNNTTRVTLDVLAHATQDVVGCYSILHTTDNTVLRALVPIKPGLFYCQTFTDCSEVRSLRILQIL